MNTTLNQPEKNTEQPVKKSKVMTPEMQKRAAERKSEFKALCQMFAEMDEPTRAKFSIALGAVTNTTGHMLSKRNTWMVKHQNPSASIVGTFNQWRAMGRYVKKGEKSVMIAVPIGGVIDEATKEMSHVKFFIAASVFDISQTSEMEKK